MSQLWRTPLPWWYPTFEWALNRLIPLVGVLVETVAISYFLPYPWWDGDRSPFGGTVSYSAVAIRCIDLRCDLVTSTPLDSGLAFALGLSHVWIPYGMQQLPNHYHTFHICCSQVTETRTGPLGCSNYDNLDTVSSVLVHSPENKVLLKGTLHILKCRRETQSIYFVCFVSCGTRTTSLSCSYEWLRSQRDIYSLCVSDRGTPHL